MQGKGVMQGRVTVEVVTEATGALREEASWARAGPGSHGSQGPLSQGGGLKPH